MNLLDRIRDVGQYNHQVLLSEEEARSLLATVEAAQSVHDSLHREFSHNLAMRDLGKALRALRSTVEEGKVGA